MMKNGKTTLWLASLSLAGLAGNVYAQTLAVPDAGALRQQIEQLRTAPLPAATPPAPPATPNRRPTSADATVEVKRFRFVGNTLLSDEQLKAAVDGFLGPPLDFDALQLAADAVAAAYREAGWLVRAFFPEQEIIDGIVQLQIVEAHFAGVEIEGQASARVMKGEVEAYFLARQSVGAPLNARELDRALLVADDLPGISVAGTLVSGDADGETALILQTTDEPFFYGNIGVDNMGARSTGADRLVANAYLNSPGGRGELLGVNLLHSEGMDYGRIALDVPDGYNGLRLGVNASFLSYEVVESPDDADTEIRGRSSGVGLEMTYPLVRTREHNLYLSAGFDHKRFFNRDVSQVSADYHNNSWRAGLSSNHFDGVWGGGVNTAAVQFVRGRLSSMEAHSQLDSIERSFHKLVYSLSRQQNLMPNHWLRLSLSGQHATQVLDSSERFYIGGPYSVRAYPVSEHGGDRAQVVSAEWRWRVRPDVLVTAFADEGRVVQLAQPSIPKDSLRLHGYGLSVGWQGPYGITAQATWARRFGDNPKPMLDGNDGDGTLRDDRFWLSATLAF